MKRKYEVKLTEEERAKIQEISNGNKVSKSIKKRANILLLCDSSAGKPMVQEEIAVRCGTSDVTVYNTLREYCTNGLEYALSYKRNQANNPPIVTWEAEARIITLACGEAPEGRARWTVRLLREKTIELKILDAVSRETIRTTLKKLNLNLT
jgi:transposase